MGLGLQAADNPGDGSLMTAPGLPTLESLEQRVQSLEQDRERFLHALRGAVAMLLDNPVASAMMPKEMKHDLRVYLEQNGNGTPPKN